MNIVDFRATGRRAGRSDRSMAASIVRRKLAGADPLLKPEARFHRAQGINQMAPHPIPALFGQLIERAALNEFRKDQQGTHDRGAVRLGAQLLGRGSVDF